MFTRTIFLRRRVLLALLDAEAIVRQKRTNIAPDLIRLQEMGHAPEAHGRIIEALADPRYRTELVILTAGLLGKGAADEALLQRSLYDNQFLYYLASVRSTFERAGVRLRIVCKP